MLLFKLLCLLLHAYGNEGYDFALSNDTMSHFEGRKSSILSKLSRDASFDFEIDIPRAKVHQHILRNGPRNRKHEGDCNHYNTKRRKIYGNLYFAREHKDSQLLKLLKCVLRQEKIFLTDIIKPNKDMFNLCKSVQFDKTKESNLFHLFVTEINELELDPTKNIDGQMPIPRFNHCSIGATSSGDIFMSLVLYGTLTRNDEYSEFIARYKSYVHPVNKRKIKIYPLMEISLETDYSIFWTEIVINDVVVDIQNYFKSFREVFRTSRMRTLFEMPRRTHPINKYNVKKKIETIRSSKKL